MAFNRIIHLAKTPVGGGGTGLVLWLNAADASSVTTVSGLVSQWNDKSGSGFNFTQANAANRPTYPGAGRNGHNTVSSQGTEPTDGFFLTCTTVSIAQPFTVFVVLEAAVTTQYIFDDVTGATRCLMNWGSAVSGTPNMYMGDTNFSAASGLRRQRFRDYNRRLQWSE